MALPLQRQLATELRLRAQVLPQEVQEWELLTHGNVKGMGIHKSQIDKVNEMFAQLQDMQNQALAALDATLPAEDFAEARMDLEQTLTGAHSLMATFRYILAQRQGTPAQPQGVAAQPQVAQSYEAALDAADLVAADCYLGCIRRANRWNNLPPDRLRQPPLTFLNAMLSPAAISRGHGFGLLGLKLYEYLEWTVPIPVISLPFHATAALSSYCSMYHEVGHLLDQDLNLRAPLRDLLEQRLPASERRSTWMGWNGEMIGDVFGVLLGGVGFAYALRSMLFKAADEVIKLHLDEHPTDYVRIFLLGALLRATGVQGLAEAADEIEQTWKERYGEPVELMPYRDECKSVAAVLLDEPLAALNGRRLRDFAIDAANDGGPDLARDQQRISDLAEYLRLGLFPPQQPFPHRLVPAATQMAIQGVADNDPQYEQRYTEIQERALDYVLNTIARPDFLFAPAADSAARREYLRGLVQNLKFVGVGR